MPSLACLLFLPAVFAIHWAVPARLRRATKERLANARMALRAEIPGGGNRDWA